MGAYRKGPSQPSRDQLITLIGGNPADVAPRRRCQMDAVLASAASEGVLSQVYHALEASGGSYGMDQETLSRFRAAALNQVATTLLLRQERERVLQQLAPLGPILLKGEALARYVYDTYADRPG